MIEKLTIDFVPDSVEEDMEAFKFVLNNLVSKWLNEKQIFLRIQH